MTQRTSVRREASSSRESKGGTCDSEESGLPMKSLRLEELAGGGLGAEPRGLPAGACAASVPFHLRSSRVTLTHGFLPLGASVSPDVKPGIQFPCHQVAGDVSQLGRGKHERPPHCLLVIDR